MKSSVTYSVFSWTLTFIIEAALCLGLLLTYGQPAGFYPILIIAVPLLLAGLYFAPLSISANDEEVRIHASLKIRSIPMAEIVNIEPYRPQPGTIRICASGGFMGYWGTFRDNVIGPYTAYYGNKNNCFLITLNSGKKYLLGCLDTPGMIDYIAAHLSQRDRQTAN